MDIEAKEFQIKMTHNELWATAFDVRNELKSSLETHWINHQNSWEQNEKDRLFRLKKMFYALGRPELYEEIFSIATDVFKKFNDKRKS